MQEKKIIVEHSTVNLAFQVEKLIHEGWKIDEKHPFQSIGVHYECGLVKVEEVIHEKEMITATLSDELAEGVSLDSTEVPPNTDFSKAVVTAIEAPKAPSRQVGRPKSK